MIKKYSYQELSDFIDELKAASSTILYVWDHALRAIAPDEFVEIDTDENTFRKVKDELPVLWQIQGEIYCGDDYEEKIGPIKDGHWFYPIWKHLNGTKIFFQTGIYYGARWQNQHKHDIVASTYIAPARGLRMVTKEDLLKGYAKEIEN